MSGTETAVRRKAPATGETVERLDHASAGHELFETAPRGPQLEVGSADDAAEHAADRLADRVIARLRAEDAEAAGHGRDGHREGHHGPARRMAGAVRRAVSPRVGREGGPAGAELSARIESMRGGGSTLDEGVRRQMSSAFGTDLSGVRVHTDSRAADAAADMGALAFTTGKDIFFGAGQYAPDTEEGRHVLAHELAHTVQAGSGTRRKVSRLWDLSTDEGTDIVQTARMRVLKDRLVLFMDDDAGDTMVVKLEKEPIGLGALAGHLQQKLNGSETIQYRKLPARARPTLLQMLKIDNLIDKPTFTARGNVNRVKSGWKHLDDPIDRAVTSVTDEINAFKDSELLAMSLAEGDSAEDLAKAPADSERSMRSMLSRPGHLRELGKVTAVDLLLGNSDRLMAGNMGNWFYDPTGALTVLDNVDGAGSMGRDNREGKIVTDQLKELADSKLKATAHSAAATLQHMVTTADPTADEWFNATMPGGKTRAVHFEAELLAGLKEGKKYISKVFGSTRWTLGGKKNRAIKKSIKKDAKAAAAIDSDDGGAPDYYETLKARAAWLKKH